MNLEAAYCAYQFLKMEKAMDDAKRETVNVFVGDVPGAELPRYQCHKKVWALKINTINRDGHGEDRDSDGSALIYPAEKGYAPFRVDRAYMQKHKPEVGGYFVVYEDGYKSFSPAKAFEDGYTRL